MATEAGIQRGNIRPETIQDDAFQSCLWYSQSFMTKSKIKYILGMVENIACTAITCNM